ncbi:FAD-dependent monooxygenase [Psychrosphaera ytuae]|uniref:FAD-dependent monooxygenase n=1 Tax=Psychrosphaera ytuae TaxID=2820710 RepID=A0A975DCD1_9GAMM|nr:FAD-dependent monooxygenase [Psychrosphaera ytuae]QTH64552.1 FAD-dependent monooxygenase [Psychrosphaera ytuae]
MGLTGSADVTSDKVQDQCESQTNMACFDVVVSGGGPTGLLTAIGIKTECPHLSVAVVEPFQDAKPQKGNLGSAIQSNFDQRCLALSYGSLMLLNHWNIWSKLKANGWPIQSIVTSDRGHIGKTIMRAADYGLHAMGQVASMHNLGLALKQVAVDLEINWFCPDKIDKLSNNNTLLTLTSGQQLTTQLLVVAEGGQSNTRDLLNISSTTSDYQQSAVIANVKVKGGTKKLQSQFDQPNNVAFERFTLNGPIAFLPIGEQEYNVVWTQTPEQAKEVQGLSDEAFCQRLQNEFGLAAGHINQVSKRACYPLSMTRVERLTAANTVLLGNTAHTVHPIAGQGFNLGVRDIGVLVFALKANLSESNEDNKIESILRHYEQNRIEDIDRIVTFTDFLVRMFGLPGRTAAFARTTSLMALQASDFLQQWLALHFMGSHKQFNLGKELNRPLNSSSQKIKERVNG